MLLSASHIRLLCEAGAGDEVLAVFASARCALQCAVALQAAFRQVTAGDISLPFPEGIGLDAGQADRAGSVNYRSKHCRARRGW